MEVTSSVCCFLGDVEPDEEGDDDAEEAKRKNMRLKEVLREAFLAFLRNMGL